MRDDCPESPAACPPRRGLSPAAGRIVGGGIGLLSVLLFAAAAARMAVVSSGQLLEPYDLVYESPNLRTIEMLAAGRPIYAAEVYDGIPFVFTMYPPLYHAVIAALPSISTNPYFTGRLVGCIALLGAAATLALVGGRAGLPSALLCIACLWLFHPVTHVTAFLKPDGLGLFLSTTAVLVAATWTERGAAVASAILATLAIWAKHACLPAALACLCVFWIRGGAARWWFIAAATLLALLSWGIASAAWGGGLIWCLRAGVSLPVFREQAVAVWQAAARQPLFVVSIAATHAAFLLYAWRTGVRGWHAPYPWYLLWADAVMAVGLGKPGSSVNYFFEPLLAGGMCFVAACRYGPEPVRWLLSAVLLAAGGWESLTGNARDYDLRLLGCPHTDRAEQMAWLHGQHAAAEARRQTILASTSPAPRLLNLCNARFSHDLPGAISLNDPYLYGTLYAVGRLAPDALIRCIETTEFDAVLLPSGHDPLRKRRSPALTALYDAVHRRYEPHALAPGLAVWVRRAGVGRHDAPGTDAARTGVAGSRDGMRAAEKIGADQP